MKLPMLPSPILMTALVLAGLAGDVVAQRIVRAGLQGDAVLRTAGGFVHPAAPDGNRFPAVPGPYLNQKIQLGKALFWDEQVSTSNTMACGTCHMPEVGGVDPRPAGRTFDALGHLVLGSHGVVPQSVSAAGSLDYGFTAPPSSQVTRGVTPTHPPTMIGAYLFRNQFWDLRAGPRFDDLSGAVLFADWAGLENQAVGPPTSDIEMGHQALVWVDPGGGSRPIEDKLNTAAPLALVVPGTVPATIPAAWLVMDYRAVFDTVFAADPNPLLAAPQGVTRERFAMALASYMRTLVPDQAPIDTNTMTPQEVQGFNRFVASGCAVCHSVSGAPALAGAAGTLVDPWDNAFSNGLPRNIFATRPGRDVGPVKVPTLRNIGLHTRFFHDGRGRIVGGVERNTLADIVDFYDLDQNPAGGGPGGPFELVGAFGPNLTPAERNAVIAFLGNALTDPRVAAALPPFDRPRLYGEVVRHDANLTRPATAAPGGWQPRMIASVPLLAEKVGGPPRWKFGVGSNGGGIGSPILPPGSLAVLAASLTPAAAGPIWLAAPVPFGTRFTTIEGFATLHATAPLSPSLVGLPVLFQWGVASPTWEFGFSELAEMTVR